MTAIYRLFDGDGELLYIGATDRLSQRLLVHRAKCWGSSITRVEIEECGPRREALQREAVAIKREEPKHNVIYNWVRIERERGPEPTIAPYLADAANWALAVAAVDSLSLPLGVPS